jgi:hypothetical protein
MVYAGNAGGSGFSTNWEEGLNCQKQVFVSPTPVHKLLAGAIFYRLELRVEMSIKRQSHFGLSFLVFQAGNSPPFDGRAKGRRKILSFYQM